MEGVRGESGWFNDVRALRLPSCFRLPTCRAGFPGATQDWHNSLAITSKVREMAVSFNRGPLMLYDTP